MKTENPQLMKCFFNEGLVLLDKEMKVFYQTKQLKVKTPESKLQLVWDMSRVEKVGEVVGAIISLVNNQYSCLVVIISPLKFWRTFSVILFFVSQQEYFLMFFKPHRFNS